MKALILFIYVNYLYILSIISLTAVVLPIKLADILRPLGGISHKPIHIFLGIDYVKYALFFVRILNIYSSTSLVLTLPRNKATQAKYKPCLGSQAAIMFLLSNIYDVSSGTVKAR